MMRALGLAAIAMIAALGCVQVGPSDEPLHIILDVNVRVQVDEAVRQLWDQVEKMAPAKPESDAGSGTDSGGGATGEDR